MTSALPGSKPATAATHSRPPVLGGALVPVLAVLIAAGIVLARRPDLLIHPKLFAEDGTVYFADVYNLGIKRTLVRPDVGYFLTYPALAAWIARFFPMHAVPFVMSLFGLAAELLPVGLLMSRRSERIVPDVRVRALLALLYVLVPDQLEMDGPAVNGQWFLAVAGLLVILRAPPRTIAGRCADVLILLISALTGPFVIILTPLAVVLRKLRRSTLPNIEICLMGLCAAIQIVSLVYISHHHGIPRAPKPALGATPDLFAKLVGGRVALGAIVGEGTGLDWPLVVQWIALVMLVCAAGAALWRRSWEVVAVLILGGAVLLAGLDDPTTGSPAWPILAAAPATGAPGAQRYFLIAEFAWLAVLVWGLAARSHPMPVRAAAGCAILASLVITVALHWSIANAPAVDFSKAVAMWDEAPRGRAVTFPIEPSPWQMVLVKR